MATTRRAVATALLVLLSSMAGLAQAAPPEYELLYTEQVSQFKGEGTLAEGDAKAFRFIVSQANVTRVDFVLTWTETGDRVRFSDPDTFELSVTPPKDSGLRLPTERSDDGNLRVRADGVNPLPEGGGAASSEEAERILAQNEAHNGMGEWSALVKLTDVGNPEGADVDEGNAFQLVVYLHHYEGVPMRVVTLTKPSPLDAARPEDTWGWATVGLAGVASLLGVALFVQQRRERALQRAAAHALPDSPEGETPGRPER